MDTKRWTQRGRDTHRERWTQKEMDTGRWTQRDEHRERWTQRDGHREMHIERDGYREMDTHKKLDTERWTYTPIPSRHSLVRERLAAPVERGDHKQHTDEANSSVTKRAQSVGQLRTKVDV